MTDNKKSALELLKMQNDEDPLTNLWRSALTELDERLRQLSSQVIQLQTQSMSSNIRRMGHDLEVFMEAHNQLVDRVDAITGETDVAPDTTNEIELPRHKQTTELEDAEFEALAKSTNRGYSEQDISEMKQLIACNQIFKRRGK